MLDQFKAVKRLLGEATELVIATDADREGEMIARELAPSTAAISLAWEGFSHRNSRIAQLIHASQKMHSMGRVGREGKFFYC